MATQLCMAVSIGALLSPVISSDPIMSMEAEISNDPTELVDKLNRMQADYSNESLLKAEFVFETSLSVTITRPECHHNQEL